MKIMILFCIVFMSANVFAQNTWGGIGNNGANTWGGIGAGLADGMNRRIQLEQQRKQQQLQAQEQRNAEERNRLMREEVRQREIEAQRQRETQEEDYRQFRAREEAAAERRAQEAAEAKQREAAEKERQYWDSRCTHREGGKRCEIRATREGYCDTHYQVVLKQQEADKEKQAKYDAAMRNLKRCAATYTTGKTCSNWANPGTRYCYKHQNFDPTHPIEEKTLTAEGRTAKDEDDTLAILGVIKMAIVDYVKNYRKMPTDMKPLRMGRYRNQLRLTDVWGRAVIYEIVRDSYILRSMGADGVDGSDDDLVVIEKLPVVNAQ